MQNIEFGVVTQKVLINVEEGTAFTPFSPVDENGAIANNGDAYGIVIDALGIGEVKQLVVMTAGCIDKICAEQHYGESYSAEAISALENIVIYDNHKIGGGGDAAIENAKETGGFGWTETNPDPLLITWDGDTTGKETVLLEGTEVCLVSNKTPESMLGYNVKLDTGESVIVTDEIVHVFDWGYAIGDIFVVCVFNDNTTVPELGIAFEHKGIYFTKIADAYYTAEVSEPAETVHTIDSKYINGGGGMLVVNLSESVEDGYVVDKTFDEITSALPNVTMISSGDVYALSYFGDDMIVFTRHSFDIDDNDNVVSLDVMQVTILPDNSVDRLHGVKAF